MIILAYHSLVFSMRKFDESFVLRIWKEDSDLQTTSHRASLRKLQSGDTRYFSDIVKLLKYISSIDDIENN